MSARQAKYLDELKLLATVREIMSSHEWAALAEGTNIVCDDDLIECARHILYSLKIVEEQKAKAYALRGVVYLTGQIVTNSAQLRGEVTKEILQRDLDISFELPGESANGLSFNWPINQGESECQDSRAARGIELFKRLLMNYPKYFSKRNDHALKLTLLALSSFYGAMMGLVING